MYRKYDEGYAVFLRPTQTLLRQGEPEFYEALNPDGSTFEVNGVGLNPPDYIVLNGTGKTDVQDQPIMDGHLLRSTTPVDVPEDERMTGMVIWDHTMPGFQVLTDSQRQQFIDSDHHEIIGHALTDPGKIPDAIFEAEPENDRHTWETRFDYFRARPADEYFTELTMMERGFGVETPDHVTLLDQEDLP